MAPPRGMDPVSSANGHALLQAPGGGAPSPATVRAFAARFASLFAALKNIRTSFERNWMP